MKGCHLKRHFKWWGQIYPLVLLVLSREYFVVLLRFYCDASKSKFVILNLSWEGGRGSVTEYDLICNTAYIGLKGWPLKIILACARLSISVESARESGRAKQVKEKEGGMGERRRVCKHCLKASFRYTSSWYTLFLVNFWQFTSTRRISCLK